MLKRGIKLNSSINTSTSVKGNRCFSIKYKSDPMMIDDPNLSSWRYGDGTLQNSTHESSQQYRNTQHFDNIHYTTASHYHWIVQQEHTWFWTIWMVDDKEMLTLTVCDCEVSTNVTGAIVFSGENKGVKTWFLIYMYYEHPTSYNSYQPAGGACLHQNRHYRHNTTNPPTNKTA